MKMKIIITCVLITITFGVYYFSKPDVYDYTNVVNTLKKDNRFVYIDENDSKISHIQYKEILDKNTFFSQKTGRYEMSFQYNYHNFDYQVDIYVDEKYHFADYEKYENYKNINYHVESGDSSLGYLTFVENNLDEYVYIVNCRFENKSHTFNDQAMNDTKDIALKFSFELIDEYVKEMELG